MTILIPGSVRSIGSDSYKYGNMIDIGNIGYTETGAFEKCESLTSVTIDDGGDAIMSIGRYTFLDCKRLESVQIGDSVISIGTGAFKNCTSLTNVTIANNLKVIGSADGDGVYGGAFQNCSVLINITIPDNVTSINASTFLECNARLSAEYKGETYLAEQWGNWVILDTGEELSDVYNLPQVFYDAVNDRK